MGSPNDHAVLSPSSASRWLACTPSARLEQQFPDSSGDAAREGTLAHAISELLILKWSGQWTSERCEKAMADLLLSDVCGNSPVDGNFIYEFYRPGMLEYCEQYAAFVMERLAEARKHTPDAMLFVEKRLDLTAYVPEGFGTGDACIIANREINVIDLKYGKGVEVSAIDNSQMKVYALGWLADFDGMYDLDKVSVTIFQPRIDNYSTWEISVADLNVWAETELKPKAVLAFNGEGDFVAGKHCGFCRAKAQCKALAEYNLELAKHQFAPPTLLTAAETVEVLERAKLFTDWIKEVQEFALAEATKGREWPGYKLVEGRSNRGYVNEQKVIAALEACGYVEDDYLNKKLKGIGDMEELVGKKKLDKVLPMLITKPPGSPTLVPESDKRPVWSTAGRAAKDFAHVDLQDDDADMM